MPTENAPREPRPGSAHEVPATRARAEFADLVNRVVYGGERVVVTRHGRAIAALVSAEDLERLERADAEAAAGPAPEAHPAAREITAPVPRERRGFGIAARHNAPGGATRRRG